MSEWLNGWWPFLLIPVAWVVSAYVGGVRRRQLQAFTRECPTCHGVGRIDREPPPPAAAVGREP